MRHLTTKIPEKVYVSVSGGADSMFALNFCLGGNRDVTAIHFNHTTHYSEKEESWCKEYCEKRGIPLVVVKVNVEHHRTKNNNSMEKLWRDARYGVYQGLDKPVVMGTNLDDAVEWWIMRAAQAQIPNLIQPENGNVIRPFLLFSKEEIRDYNTRHSVPWIEDPDNISGNLRARFRTRVIPTIDELTELRSRMRNRYRKLYCNMKGT